MHKPGKHTIDELNQLYIEADTVDQELFAEQRSNVLLIAGDHYNRRDSKHWNRIRDNRELSNEQKLRLTKNHLQKITKTYRNNISSFAPSVTIIAKNDKELQNQKAAELNKSVWQDSRQRHGLRNKTKQWIQDFIDIGEVAVKIYWDPNAGKLLGFQAEMDEAGNPVMDDTGQMVASKTPIFSGDFVYDRIFGANLLRDPTAKSMDESKFLCIRKMVDIDALKAIVGDDEEKQRKIASTPDETFLVFDGSQKSYKKSDKQTMLREFYFKPCHEYPKGYFYITIESEILFEGELPFGIFPIIYAGFDEVQTTPRHRSIIKQLRPYQAEINRSASKIAEHQVTLGDDKILVQSGTKITNGGTLPGVRTLQYSGMAPTILSGRAGDQYLTYMQSQIAEMYQVANLTEDSQATDMKMDPFGALFASIRNKKKFSIYGEKIEEFLIKVCETFLELAREYYDDNQLIPAIGKNEYVNITDFKNSTPLLYQIKLEPMTDDVETMMGKTLSINHVLQYVGNQLSKEDIGKLIRSMPLGDLEESYSDLTIDYDSATNMILALDRGENPQPNKYDEAEYMIKKLTHRTRMADFAQLDPQIQQNYQNMITIYDQIVTERQQQIQMAQSGFIPSGGALITCQMQMPNEKGEPKQVRLPYEALTWLIKKMEEQGSSQETLQSMNQGALAEISGLYNQQQQSGPQQGMPMGPSPMSSLAQ